jgi:hypothetical protein
MSRTTGRKATKMPSRAVVVKADEARVAEAEKTARLRALRLAKEVADRDAALHVASPARVSGSASEGLRSTSSIRKSALRTEP